MMDFEVTPLRQSSIAYLHRLRPSIRIDPPYQRQGEVWSTAKQQLLIDSIINEFDIPKIYLHHATSTNPATGTTTAYALIDGRQRLEAIWDFIDNRYPLSEDFVYIEDNSTSASGLTYNEVAERLPHIAAKFNATSLDVMTIRTEDLELIEEMFSRLNEAVPLNAAEKRNGRGGPLREAVHRLCQSDFFQIRLPFANTRYRHYDLATKFLLWADAGKPTDAKKRQLDDFWTDIKEAPDGSRRTSISEEKASLLVSKLSETFIEKDPLLSSVGMISVYYLLFSKYLREEKPLPTRSTLVGFNEARKLNRYLAEEELPSGMRDLLEFDRLAQSPNDVGALNFRLSVLEQFIENPARFTGKGNILSDTAG